MQRRTLRLGFRRPDNARWGAAAVEMAIVLPIFVSVVMGIVEFGRAMMVSQLVTNSARHGTRLAIVDGATNTSVATAVKTFLQQSTGVAQADVAVTITVTAAPGNPNPANQLASAQPKDTCTVAVSVPFNKVAIVTGKFLMSTNLKGSCTMRHE